MSRVAIIAALLLLSLVAFAQENPTDSKPSKTAYDPTDDLLTAFRESCSSIGSLSTDALAQTTALKRVLEGMKNDPTCDNLHSALSGYTSSQQQMYDLMRAGGASWRRNKKEASLNQLIAAITSEEDPATKELMRSQLALEKVDLVNMGYETSLERREMMYRSAANFVSYSELALGALGTESACLQKRPGLGIQLSGQILASSAGFMNGPLGPAFFALGSAINSLVKYFADRKYNKLIKKATITRLGPALGCALESLAASYCQARDTSLLVRANANPQEITGNEDEWIGLRLLDRDIQRYNSWVTRIVAGAPPADGLASQRKARGNLLEAALRIATDKFSSALAEAANKEATSTTDKQKQNIRRQALIELARITFTYVTTSGGNGGGYYEGMTQDSPFYSIFSYDTTCGPRTYFFTGLHTPPMQQNGQGCPIDSTPAEKIPDLQTLATRVDLLLVETSASVANEVALVRENDFLSVLARAELSGNSVLEATAFLQRARDYLGQIESDRSRSPSRNLFTLISDTRGQIERAMSELSSRAEPKEKVKLLQEILAPNQDISFLSKRLADIVQWDLNDKLKSGKIKEGLSLIYRDSLRDTLSLAEEIGVFNLNAQAKDTATARTLTIQNMELVMEIFSDQLAKYFADVQDQRARIKDSSFDESLNILCMQASLIPDLQSADKKMKLRSHCAGRTQKVVYDRLKLEMRFDEQANKDFSKRVCGIYDIERKSRIFGLSR
ncbi:MAG: hypothetical protein ABL958_02270 [Bdellovibrionia bacterium]